MVGKLTNDPLERHVKPVIDYDVKQYLERVGTLDGVPTSGNMAMFFAVLLLHANRYLSIDTEEKLVTWVALHVEAQNEFGFWRPASRSL